MNARTAIVLGSVTALAGLGLPPLQAGGAPTVELLRLPVDTDGGTGTAQPGGIATFSTLPALHRGPSEALAVDEAGTIIVGYSWDRFDRLHAVKWTQQNGSWAISSLPWPPGATSAIARGVNNLRDVAGNDFPSNTSRAVLWPAATGGFVVLGCATDPGAARVYGISADTQVVVGGAAGTAAAWRPGACREQLPSLPAGGGSTAFAVSADGTIVGGAASSTDGSVPVRWRNLTTGWQIEPLDTRRGWVQGANAAGDLAGLAYIPCTSNDGCQRALIWYIDGGSRELGTLGGEDSWARDINGSREVVGASTSSNGVNTGYFWSESTGMVQLPFKGRWAAANALSDLRADGTRLVVGMASTGEAVVWVVRNP